MFGVVGPRLIGGLNKLHQVITSTFHQFKGPVDLDLKISAGDKVYASGQGSSLYLEAGSSGAYNTSKSSLTGGDVNISAGVGVTSGTGGTGGAVNVTGGQGCVNASATGNGGAVNITGGRSATATVGDGNGGNVVITGGAAGQNSGGGGKVTLQGGTTPSAATGTGDIEIFGGLTTSGSTGSKVTIRPGNSATNKGNILLDGGLGSALATNAAGGFVQCVSMAGLPTGVVSLVSTGLVPMVFDTTNFKLMAYINTTWYPVNEQISQHALCGGI